MSSSKITYDIFLGDRFFHTMVSRVQPVTRFVNGRFTDVIDMQDLLNEVRQRLPSIGSRPDLRILL